MAYCTQSDIEKLIPVLELAELTAESGSTPNAAIVTECIAKADAEIDSYLGVKYTVPLTCRHPGEVSFRRHLPFTISLPVGRWRRSCDQKHYDNAIAYPAGCGAGKAS